MQQDNSKEEEFVPKIPKRKHTAAIAKQSLRSNTFTAGSSVKCPEDGTRRSREHTLRRQSTMTQLLDGRRPRADIEEPDFRPVKRSQRVSWSGKGRSTTNNKQQRTLTQMVPGMRPLEIMSDEDTEEALSDLDAQEQESQTYDDAVAQRLAQQGYYRASGNADQVTVMELEVKNGMRLAEESMDHGLELQIRQQSTPVVVVQSVEDVADENGEDNYQPTQHIPPPSLRTGRQPQRRIRTPRSIKSKFSLLSTPEKRRIREIPSSQSPADSPLSTQVSPCKVSRLTQKEHQIHQMVKLETPSRRKQVAFTTPSTGRSEPPPLKKFESTIRDSEDEDEHAIEYDVPSSADHRCDPARQSYSKLVHAADQLRSMPLPTEADTWDTFPSTPMIIQDDSSDQDDDSCVSVPYQSSHTPSLATPANEQQSSDLGLEPIQVPRSPSALHETQQSHSSKSEQQLQHEWKHFSQYIDARPPESSSMNMVHDAFSYTATQKPQPSNTRQSQSMGHHLSQATTIDEVTQVTPKRNKIQHIARTPHRITSSQPAISPSKPPPLFIPSSFPSPAKVAMENWSSPMYDGTQYVFRSSQVGASLESFSIPPPPPFIDD